MLIRFRPSLRVAQGKLVSRGGTEVHAAAFLKKRELVLESALLDSAPELIRIFTHEVFHFAWRRLDNKTRKDWEVLLLAERERKVRGELGWSSESRKQKLKSSSGTAWKDYICESFCDTAAWFFHGRCDHEEFTLSRTARTKRGQWFEKLTRERRLPI
jgi:hypothetical protein